MFFRPLCSLFLLLPQALLPQAFVAQALMVANNKEQANFFSEESQKSQTKAISSNRTRSFKKPKSLQLAPFPVIYNQEVEKWVQYFSRSPYFKLWLKRSYRYFPIMEEILRLESLPTELTYMTLVESSLSPRAKSIAQAVGYWQFIPQTGRRFGLRINHWIDERQDFRKSTFAASKYLRFLYHQFEDWLLAMSAYNMGEDRLEKIIQKSGTKNFWLLAKRSDFPRETALYVPKILAAGRIIKRPELYGLEEFQILLPYSYDIFFTPGGLDLQKMFLETKIPLKELQKLNPDLKSHKIPKSIPLHQLRIPKGTGLKVSKWLDKQTQKR